MILIHKPMVLNIMNAGHLVLGKIALIRASKIPNRRLTLAERKTHRKQKIPGSGSQRGSERQREDVKGRRRCAGSKIGRRGVKVEDEAPLPERGAALGGRARHPARTLRVFVPGPADSFRPRLRRPRHSSSGCRRRPVTIDDSALPASVSATPRARLPTNSKVSHRGFERASDCRFSASRRPPSAPDDRRDARRISWAKMAAHLLAFSVSLYFEIHRGTFPRMRVSPSRTCQAPLRLLTIIIHALGIRHSQLDA
ncbi:uncharacterized protein LOC124297781 [Neodiprion virginianus]|uniref:uncharacterized protein LOC124297781 n=1 Tax=Neodiprion virginianus TaxID=2961670 RepID=UPI001EE75C62|nr:uncharacterized protein LOC124297781 [Neodiprion virginianus]